ncbi:MAG: hypothetical protein PHE68_00680 [Candidatus Peribacteraceae bacterium]|nr:hypothetical protein [Candidatus Peribacteraceae bacterium]
MADRFRWTLIIGGIALLLGVVMEVPQLRYILNPASRGVLVGLSTDESLYRARVEEALAGNPAHATQPFTGEPWAPGAQFALIEQTEGLAFRWTGWRAATVFQIMDFVIPVFLFLTIFALFRFAQFGRRRSLFGALLFLLPVLYGLNRPVHQRTSSLLVLVTILLAMHALEKRSLRYALASGFLLGTLQGVYLWSWMFAWIYIGLLFLWELAAWWRSRPRENLRDSRFGTLIVLCVIGVISALPYVFLTFSLSKLPLYQEMAWRQALHAGRWPESWIYSLLFLAMSAGLLLALRSRPELAGRKRFILLFPIAVLVLINQQLIHGHIFLFTSHSVFPVFFGAVSAFLLGSLLWNKWLMLPLLAALPMIGGIAWDNRAVFSQFSGAAYRLNETHFASLLPVLDNLPRATILSDPDTSAFIAGQTRHDILSIIYLDSALMSNQELAERLCLSLLPYPPEARQIDERKHLIWPEANRVRAEEGVHQREIALMKSTCATEDRDPASYLEKYGVRYVVWDQRRSPEWDPKNLKVKLEKDSEEAGAWVLYRIVY